MEKKTGIPTPREDLIANLASSLCRTDVLLLCERSPVNAGSLRRLCDAILRCALAEASTEQVLPALRKAKVCYTLSLSKLCVIHILGLL